jgi:hypothetical protein
MGMGKACTRWRVWVRVAGKIEDDGYGYGMALPVPIPCGCHPSRPDAALALDLCTSSAKAVLLHCRMHSFMLYTHAAYIVIKTELSHDPTRKPWNEWPVLSGAVRTPFKHMNWRNPSLTI